MYRKIVWCYLIGLTLLDISLNTKLSAQGKSHGNGVSVHESLMEGISLQEWGKESNAEGAGHGRAAPPDAVSLSPGALEFGPAALATAHARAVTVTNTANETIHLASVAGSTPDFHASFFESKTLVPQANTTFIVVYLGRREGPVSTHLFIHTSKGVLRYPVSALGVASAWRVWPLVGVRVPLNATLEPLLTLYNPTDTTVQVSEVYSSGSWLGLRLPDGGDSAPRALWTLPPHATRPLVRLRIRPPPPHQAPRIAYIRIRGDMAGGGLLLAVEAGGAAPGEFLSPLQLRIGARGARDPPGEFALEAGNSAAAGAALDAEVWGARCGATPPDPPPPPALAARPATNGAHAEGGARVTLLRERLDAHQPLAPAARLTLDYGALWAGAEAGAGAAEAWCAGWVRVGRAAAPYSVRVLRGGLALTPHELHFVTAAAAAAWEPRTVRAHNEFPLPVRVHHVYFPSEVEELFHTESLAPLVLRAGAAGAVARLRLRGGADAVAARGGLRARLILRTNVTDYELPLLLYEGKLHFEWEWPGGAGGELALGTLGASSTRRVAARLRNRGAAPLCVTGLRATLPGATLELHPPHQRCVEPGGAARAVLTVVAPARDGALAGACSVSTPHADTDAPLSLTAAAGRVAVPPVLLDGAAPYVWARAPLVLESSMAVRMSVTRLAQPPPHADAALSYILPDDESLRSVAEGRSAVGSLVYAAEALCEPRCSTGLDTDSADGAAWVARGAAPAAEALAGDAALRAERLARFAAGDADLAVLVHTSRVLALPAAVRVRRAWPALAAGGAGRAGLAGVGGAAALRVRVRNPAVRPLLVQARVGGAAPLHAPECGGCEWSAASFALGEWRGVRGGAAGWPPGAAPAPYVLLEPDAEIELALTFSPTQPADLAAILYLRNNLTILESVPLSGRGAFPSFELAGREPNSTSAIVLEAGECGAGGAGTVRRTVLLRNTGAVPVRLRDWRVGGAPCVARGFRLQPCAALSLAPNESRALVLSFTPDWTRARAHAALSVRAGAARATFALAAAAPARLVARCAPAAPRPPFEPALRTLGDALALLALAAVVALAAADAERALRRHRSAREAAPPRAPLDLRALALAEPAPAPPRAPPPPPRRRRTPRARGPPPDPAAERLAFEQWRAEVSRRAPSGEESRSSEDGEAEAPAAPPAPAAPRGDASSSSAESSRRDSYGAEARGEAGSTASDSSAGSERSEPEDESPPPAPHARRGPDDSPPRPEPHTPSHAHDRDPDAHARRGAARAGAARGAGSGGAASGGARPRPRSGGARKERAARRRERAEPPPPSAEPARPDARAPPAVRWGASWSSVVSRGAAEPPPHGPAAPAPLAPIGSDVRRRAASHSLFYYGAAPDARPEPEYAPWPAPVPTPPAPHPRRDYIEDPGSGAFRSLESVWGASMEPHPAAAAWLWGGGGGGAGALRPPPGFAAPPVRSFDPFHSLASIWTPAALDWRRPARADGDADADAAPPDTAPAADN